MAKIFHVTTPDGKTLEVTGPDDATPEQAIEQAKQLYNPGAAPVKQWNDMAPAEQQQVVAQRRSAALNPPAAPSEDRSTSQVAIDQAVNAGKGAVSAVTGIPGIVREAGGIISDSLQGKAGSVVERLKNVISGAAHSVADPIATSARGVAAYAAPDSVRAPSSQDWATAARDAGALAGNAVIGKVAESIPASAEGIQGVANKLRSIKAQTQPGVPLTTTQVVRAGIGAAADPAAGLAERAARLRAALDTKPAINVPTEAPSPNPIVPTPGLQQLGDQISAERAHMNAPQLEMRPPAAPSRPIDTSPDLQQLLAEKAHMNAPQLEMRSPSLPELPPVDFAKDADAGNNWTKITVPTSTLNDAWSKDGDFYIPKGGGGAEIGGRRAGVEDFLKTGKPVNAPRVHVDETGRAAFEDGRHRFSVLRDAGYPNVDVLVDSEHAARIKQQLMAGIEPTPELQRLLTENAHMNTPQLEMRESAAPPSADVAATSETLEQKLLSAMDRLEERGNSVTFYKLRKQPEFAGVSKEAFDEAARSLQQQRQVEFAVHDHADRLSQTDQNELVPFREFTRDAGDEALSWKNKHAVSMSAIDGSRPVQPASTGPIQPTPELQQLLTENAQANRPQLDMRPTASPSQPIQPTPELQQLQQVAHPAAGIAATPNEIQMAREAVLKDGAPRSTATLLKVSRNVPELLKTVPELKGVPPGANFNARLYNAFNRIGHELNATEASISDKLQVPTGDAVKQLSSLEQKYLDTNQPGAVRAIDKVKSYLEERPAMPWSDFIQAKRAFFNEIKLSSGAGQEAYQIFKKLSNDVSPALGELNQRYYVVKSAIENAAMDVRTGEKIRTIGKPAKPPIKQQAAGGFKLPL